MNLSQLDYQWFQAINSLAGVYPGWNSLMAFCSLKLDYLFYLGVIVYWFTRTDINRRMVFHALLSACAALAANGIIGAIYHRDRPFVAHDVIQLIQHDASASFPSNHAAASFAIAAAIWAWRRKDGWVWFVLAAAISFSRVWSGVHYPSDVVAGAILGIACSAIIGKGLRSWRWLQVLSESLMKLYEKVEHKVWKV